jgi:hypothetical protein
MLSALFLDNSRYIMTTKTQLLYLLVVLTITSLSVACGRQETFHATPLVALTEFPGYVNAQTVESVVVLQEEMVAGGLVLLYQFSDSAQPAGRTARHCLATTFVTQERNGGWRAQSASKLGCGRLNEQGFSAMFTVGGNVTDLTTAYGWSQEGDRVRIEWSDGRVDLVPIVNNTFLLSRPETLQVNRFDLLPRE